ncbi:unknown [Clostridium sp. CAG:567]|nr:unknown [Clostridium sp. CAG:567]
MVKNYLPDAWKEKTSATTLSFTDGKLVGTISYAKDAKKTYTITVANGIVTGVE